MKKRGVVTQNVIVAILTLIVIGIGARITLDLTGQPVRYLLGLGNMSAFDRAVVERYNATKNMNHDAIKSTAAFLYSVNRIAQSDQETLDVEWSEVGRDFGSVRVIPTIQNLKPLYLGAGGRDPGEQLAKALVDCWTIFADEANENKYCFVLETGTMPEGKQVTYDGLMEGFQKLQEEGYCGEACEDKIEDLQGDSWGWTIVKAVTIIGNAFHNLEQIDWDSDIIIKKGTKNVIVCADNTAVNEVHITTVDSGNCQLNAEEKAANKEQIFIEGFSLPQKIAKSSNPFTYVIEEWLNAYGDPEYILFYEKFPEEEAQYWQAGAYRVAFLSILATEAVFLGFDLITWGMSSAYTKTIGKTFIGDGVSATWKFIKGLGRKALGAFGKALKYVFGRPVNFLIRKRLKLEVVSNIMEKVSRSYLQGMSRASREGIEKGAKELLEEISEDTTGRLITKSGKLTKLGRETYLRRFRAMAMTIAGKELPSETLERLTKELGEELVQAELRIITRAMVRLHRATTRMVNMIRTSVTGEVPDEKLIALVGEADRSLAAVKPRDLRTVAANIDQIAERGITDMSKESLEQLNQRIMRYGTGKWGTKFQAGVLMQKYVPRATRSMTPRLRARHLIAIEIAYLAAKLDSMAEKTYPVGTNAFGLKTPLMHTVVYDDSHTKEGLIKTKDLMDKFGQEEKYFHILPEVDKYYVSLTRDKHAYWFDQDPIRFHLVSPCYADIMIRVTNCECGYHPDEEAGWYETGKKYEIFGQDEEGNRVPTGEFTEVPDFDGKNPMLYRLDDTGRPVKECVPSAFFQFDNIYKPRCIQVNPVLYEDVEGEYNYCYHGVDPSWEVTKGVITALEVGLPLLGLYCGPAANICMAGIGFAAGVAGETLKAAVETTHQWPNHE